MKSYTVDERKRRVWVLLGYERFVHMPVNQDDDNVLLLALVNFAVLKLLMFAETYYLFSVRFEEEVIKRSNQNALDLNSDHFKWLHVQHFEHVWIHS